MNPRFRLSPLPLIRIGSLLCVLWVNVSFNHSPAARSEFWFRDGGFTLNTVQNLLDGKHLYLDSFYQYGSLPIGLYTFVSRFFGNGIAVFSNYLLTIHVLCIIVVFAVLAAGRCDLKATALILLCLSSFMVKPLILQYECEQFLTLIAMVIWQAPATRKRGRSVLLGLVLGVMQWVRFGSSAGPILGVLVADLLSLYTREGAFTRKVLQTWLKQGAVILGGFLLVESALLIQLFVTLPRDVAQDVALPFYMLGSFSAYDPQDRHPHWISLNYFLGSQMTAVVAFLCVAYFLGAQMFSSRARQTSIDENQTSYRFIVPFVAYLANAAFFYQQVWHYYVGLWLLGIGAACGLRSLRMPARIALALLFLPGAYIALRPDSKHAPAVPSVMTTTPRGERLWLPPELLARTDNLVAALAEFEARESSPKADRKGVIILERQPVTVSSHLHFFYLIPQAIRHTMIFPGWLRPRDLRQMERTIPEVTAVVLLQEKEQGPPPKDICRWNTYAFPSEFCTRVSDMLMDPIPVDGSSWIFPVKRATSGTQ
jgi:hypothetical protein